MPTIESINISAVVGVSGIGLIISNFFTLMRLKAAGFMLLIKRMLEVRSGYELVAELTALAGPHLGDLLRRPPRPPVGTGVLRMRHPDAGELHLTYETLRLPERDGQRILAYLPADAATETALAGLAGTGRAGAGALRVVRG